MFCVIVPVSANFHRTFPPDELVFVKAVTVTDVILLTLRENSVDFTHGAFQGAPGVPGEI